MAGNEGKALFDEPLIVDEVVREEMAAAKSVIDEQSRNCRFSLALYDPGTPVKNPDGTRAITFLCSFGPGEDRIVAEGQVKLWFGYAPERTDEKPIVIEIWPQETKGDVDITRTLKASGSASGKVLDVVSLKGTLAAEQTVKFKPVVIRGFGQGGSLAQWEFEEAGPDAAGLGSGGYLMVVLAAPAFRALSLEAEVAVTTRSRSALRGTIEKIMPFRLGRRGQRNTVTLPPA